MRQFIGLKADLKWRSSPRPEAKLARNWRELAHAHPMLDAATTPALDPHNRSNHHRCGSRWGVVQTHPQAERWAAANLNRQGYQTYLPLLTTQRPDRATPTIRHPVIVPLWAGYLFVNIRSDLWAPIKHTRGVARLLMAGSDPHMVNASLLDALQAAEPFSAPSTHWKPGSLCSLAAGPLAGLPAVVTDRTGDQITVTLMFLGSPRQISVDAECLTHRSE